MVQGDEVTITIDGEDEGTAMFTMKKLIISNFSDIPQMIISVDLLLLWIGLNKLIIEC